MKKMIIGVVIIGSVLFFSGCSEDTYNAFPEQPTSISQMMGNEKVVGWINYKKDSDKDGIADYKDKCPATPKGAKVDFKGCPILQIFRFNFKFNSYKIDKKYYPKIEKLAKLLKKNKKIKIKIEGFTDNIGSYDYNKKLSLKRANALKDILVHKFNINSKRITIAGYGKDYPIASNKTEDGRRLNRRVVVIDKSQYLENNNIDCIVK
jgi:OOP family OmpA-OmpF porin